MISSRFLRSGMSLAAALLIGGSAGFAVLHSSAALAAAPLSKVTAPGFYRTTLGYFEITALSDGTVQLPMEKLLTNTTPGKVNKAFEKYHISTPVDTSVNGYLINTGNKLVLIDAGAGKLFGPTLGKLVTSLKASGYTPDQIDEIYITHMHADHVGGLTDENGVVFPNAVVRADVHDADFWLSEENLNKAADGDKGFFQGAMISLLPYIKAGKFKPFNGDTNLMPGIKAVSSYGHTPGHTIYEIESAGQKLMLWGDLMHVAAVQFDNPAVTIQFDSDSKNAAIQRKKAYADAAKQGYMVGAAHISFPGLGYVRPEGKAYAWTPLNYVSWP